MPRTTPVVAVFGSTLEDTVDRAFAVGEAVARAGCVLLTGGGRSPHERSVKEQAVQGARAAQQHGARAPRVGVLGVESTASRIEVDGWQVILEPDLGDDRNFVNAAMCDVAIAFPGGPGTDSEVAFALALGRPVVLVGSGWETTLPPGEDDAARDALVASARTRVTGAGGRATDALVRAAYEELPHATLRVERVGLDHDPDDVVGLARGMVELAGLVGDVPQVADRPDLARSAATYREWLARVDAAE